MASTILPNDNNTFLPITPTDGQIFIDADRERWVFDAENEVWEKAGIVDEIPIADAETIGLLSAFDKLTLDSVPAVGGGFGLIVDPKLTPFGSHNPEGIITNDIQLVSESLDIVCVGSDLIKLNCDIPISLECTTVGSAAGLMFKLSEKFLKTLIVDHVGPKGKKGDLGLKGLDGEPGFSDGPQGLKGKAGESITELCSLENVTYNDIDGITDTAIVNLQMLNTEHGCKLIVTKSKLNVLNTSAADKIIVNAIGRSVVYDQDADTETCDVTRLSQWRLAKASTDETPLNMQLLRLANGQNESNNPIGFNGNLTLEDLVTAIVTEYSTRLTDLDAKWGLEVKNYIQSIDDKARSILNDLANQVTMCEFNLPATEFCITLTPCDSSSLGTGGTL